MIIIFILCLKIFENKRQLLFIQDESNTVLKNQILY
jgi:hypothetical protein